jgi:lipoyl(octanoyl) transferase
MRWRWILDSAAGQPVAARGSRNMAVDAVLLDSVATGAPPAVRFYRWAPACLSLGRNQVAIGVYDRTRVAAQGLDVVRRPTGGLAVLHDLELTYAIVAPAALLGGPRSAYRDIHLAIAAGLATLGIKAGLAEAGASISDRGFGAAPCFASPAGGEVIVGKRKLVGSAQRYERRTLLQHGSILVEGRQDRVGALRTVPDTTAVDASITVAELLGSAPPWHRLVSELARGIEQVLGVCLHPVPLDEAEQTLAARLEETYRDDAWTWRR